MRKIKHLLLTFIFLLLYCSWTNAKYYTIRNNDDNFINLDTFLKNIQNDDIILNFEDSYYDMTILSTYSVEVTLNVNLSIIGNKNGTVFDYKNGRRGPMIFNILTSKKETIKIENIIFKNFSSENNIYTLKVGGITDNFEVYINNCDIINNNYRFLNIDITCTYQNQIEPQFVISNCNF